MHSACRNRFFACFSPGKRKSLTPVPIQSLIGLLRRASVASVASRARVSEPPEPLRWPQAPAPPTPPEERERKGREKTKRQMHTNEMSRADRRKAETMKQWKMKTGGS